MPLKNISARCLAKACAFSTLLLAQIPCDVRSGEEGFLTRFIFLISFQRNNQWILQV
jgi:hypothetical protein